jgi:hypothetical protein
MLPVDHFFAKTNTSSFSKSEIEKYITLPLFDSTMVVKTETISRQRAPSQEECYSQLPQKFLDELNSLELHYPGWGKDFRAAKESFDQGSEATFVRCLWKLKDKQRVYDEYKAHMRLNALAAVELAYPGHEFDKQKVEEWHLLHPSNDDETDMIFQDKLEGLRNKDKLFLGDRSHPNIQDLDRLELSYPGWEDDYQAAVTGHCDTPAKSFANKLHRLRQKQSVYEGERSHWRLVELDGLNLTYLGWETDFAEVEDWHFNNADNTKNDKLYAEVIEGMRDQQQIYLGWDHEEEAEDEDSEEDTSSASSEGCTSSLESSSGFPRSTVEKEKAKMNELVQIYASIAENVDSMEGKKKKLLEERSTCPSNPASSHTGSATPQREKSNPGDKPQKSGNPGRMTVTVPMMFSMKTEEVGPRPPKQVTLGKCEVCLIRKKTHVFTPCGHLCACAACSHKAMEETGTCPICRNESENSFRVFLT